MGKRPVSRSSESPVLGETVRPSDAETRELLHYFDGIASEGARRQVIAKARVMSSSERYSSKHFENLD